MADFNVNLKQSVSPKVMQRTVLLGRVKMAQAIGMKESEWAKTLAEIEKDSLFQELLGAKFQDNRIISYKRNSRTGISGQFYEMQDANVVGSTTGSPEALFEEKKHLLVLIEKIGQANFEKFFLFRERADNAENIANQCGISVAEAKEINDFILDMSVQAEFFHPSHLDSNNIIKPTLVGRIIKNEDGTFSVSFYSPHLARGQYEINRDALKNWQKNKKLNREEASKIRKFVGILELSNLKQGAFWRVVEYLLVLQKEYLNTQDISKMAPVSLRKVAKHLQFAPSTISRVLGSKSILMPWEREAYISDLMPGQRKVILSVLEKILNGPQVPKTDSRIAQKLKEEHGIKVSRRTITACRHFINQQNQEAA